MAKILSIEKVTFPKMSTAFLAALLPTAVAINVAGAAARQALGIPLFLDTGGTLLVIFMAGPKLGVVCAILQGVVSAFMINPMLFIGCIPTIVVALIVGYAARAGITRTWVGLIGTMVVVQPFSAVASAFVYTYMYGGFTGTTQDILSAVIAQATGQIFAGSFFSTIIMGAADKLVLMVVVLFVLRALPPKYRIATPLRMPAETEEEEA